MELPIADYATDQRSVLEQAPRVLAALIDVAGDAGCVHATLALLELSQAISVQVLAARRCRAADEADR